MLSEFRVDWNGFGPAEHYEGKKVHLSVYRDGEYFQFINAVASGIDLFHHGEETMTTSGRFWKAFALEAVPLIRLALVHGDIPLRDPIVPFEVRPDVHNAVEHSRIDVSGDAVELGTIATFRLEVVSAVSD